MEIRGKKQKSDQVIVCVCVCVAMVKGVWLGVQVETVAESLDLGQVFLLDCRDVLYIWCGSRSSLMARSKARLLAEKINKFERKGQSAITQLKPVGASLSHSLSPSNVRC